MKVAFILVATIVLAWAAPAAAAKPAPPPPPTNPSTLEDAGVNATLLLDETGVGSGKSQPFTPPGAKAASQSGPAALGMARIRVEWACNPGDEMKATVTDGSGTISSVLKNGFDGPIPTRTPPMRVKFKAKGACSWHVRALNQG